MVKHVRSVQVSSLPMGIDVSASDTFGTGHIEQRVFRGKYSSTACTAQMLRATCFEYLNAQSAAHSSQHADRE